MIVYKITNLITGKLYIGQTTRTLEQRWKQHLVFVNRNKNTKLSNAIRKYGTQSFLMELIEEALNQQILNDREQYWIEFYNTLDPKIGYNMTKGGTGGDTFTNNPNREQIQANMKLRPGITDESRRKKSELLKQNNPMHDPEIRARHKQAVEQREWKGGTVLKDLNTKQVTCPHCKKSGGYMSFKQFHFDRCETLTGIKHTKPEYTCPYCNKAGKGASNMQRWHFENCKYK